MVGALISFLPGEIGKAGVYGGFGVALAGGFVIFTLAAVSVVKCLYLAETLQARRTAGAASTGEGASIAAQTGAAGSSSSSSAPTPAGPPVTTSASNSNGSKFLLYPDIATIAFGPKTRFVSMAAFNVYLVLQCASYLLIMGAGFQTIQREVHILGRTGGGRQDRTENELLSHPAPHAAPAEVFGCALLMAVVCQLRSIKGLGRLSFVGTACIFAVVVLFMTLPYLVKHADGKTPQMILSGPVRVSATSDASQLTGEHQKPFLSSSGSRRLVWDADHNHARYVSVEPETRAWPMIAAITECLGVLGSAFACATTIPHLRMGMAEPEKITSAVVVAKTCVALTYFTIALFGLLTLGYASMLIAEGSMIHALQDLSTHVVPAGDANRAAGDKSVISTSDDGRFALVRDTVNYAGSVPLGNVLALVLAALSVIKTLISYPLTLWPVLVGVEAQVGRWWTDGAENEDRELVSSDNENMVSRTYYGTTDVNNGGAAASGGGDPAADATSIANPPAGGSVTVSSSPDKVVVTIRRKPREQSPRHESDGAVAAPPEPREKYDVPLQLSIVVRGALVMTTFLFCGLFGFQLRELSVITDFAVGTAGVFVLILLPMAAQLVLQHRLRDEDGKRAGAGEVVEGVAYGFCMLVGMWITVHSLIATPKNVVEVLR
eukprot:g6606.t1